MVQVNHWKFNEEAQKNASYITYSGIGELSDADAYVQSRILIENNELPNYISFDGRGIDLNDIHSCFYKSGDYVGLISSDVSDDNLSGGFEISIPCLKDGLEYDFSKGITIAFYGKCCSEITVRYTMNDEYLTNEYEDISVEDEIFHFQPLFLSGLSSINIGFTKTVLPNQFIKIAYIKFGDVTVYNKFKDINLLEEINVLSDDLPINTLDFTVAAETMDFKENDEMSVYSNGTYYGTFYYDDSEHISKKIYSAKALNCIKKLEETQFRCYDFLQASLQYFIIGDEFLQNASVSKASNVTIESEVNLSEIYVFGYVPENNSCRFALCAFAYAGCLMVDGSRSDKVLLKRIPNSITSVITTDSKRIIGECTYKKSKPIKRALLQYPKTYIPEACTIECDNEADMNYEIMFPDAPTYIAEEEILGNHVIREKTLGHITFTAKNPNTVLTGNNYKLVRSIADAVNLKALNGEELKFDKFDLIKTNYSGPCITEDKVADIEKYIKSGGTIKGKIRLRGECVGDLIQIETAFDGMKTGIITSMNISFGYEDVADIEVLEWSL